MPAQMLHVVQAFKETDAGVMALPPASYHSAAQARPERNTLRRRSMAPLRGRGAPILTRVNMASPKRSSGSA